MKEKESVNIPNEIFEYHEKGLLSDEQVASIMMMIYEYTWEGKRFDNIDNEIIKKCFDKFLEIQN